jgi:hypothetical protein
MPDISHAIPASIKAQAQCQLKHTKTDAVDALLIASFSQTTPRQIPHIEQPDGSCHLFILLTAESQRCGEKEAESQIFSPPQRLCGEKEIISVKVATQVN